MEDTSQLILGVIFGGIGIGYFFYGKKQRSIVPLAVGIALCVFPYFISNTIMLVVVGVVLIAIPRYIKI